MPLNLMSVMFEVSEIVPVPVLFPVPVPVPETVMAV